MPLRTLNWHDSWPPPTERCSVGALSSRPWTPRSQSCGAAAAPCSPSRGEGGIGKTRLLDELAARADAAGALVLSGRASELERELPFGVWEDALAEHAEFLGVDRLERLVGDQLPELAAVLPAVGRVPAGLQDERYRTHRAVRALLEALAQRQPIVLVLDDLHWADDASLELVAHLLRRPPRGRVALALAFRPAPMRPLLATALATAERDGSVIEHPLGALSFADAETLLGAEHPGPGARRDLRGGRRQPVLPAAARAPARRGPQRRRGARRARACRARSRARSSRRSRR